MAVLAGVLLDIPAYQLMAQGLLVKETVAALVDNMAQAAVVVLVVSVVTAIAATAETVVSEQTVTLRGQLQHLLVILVTLLAAAEAVITTAQAHRQEALAVAVMVAPALIIQMVAHQLQRQQTWAAEVEVPMGTTIVMSLAATAAQAS
jgi:hypothetical protein